MAQTAPRADKKEPQMRPFEDATLHSFSGWTSRCVQVLASAGVFDALGSKPETAAELARKTACNPDALDRMMRLLAAVKLLQRRPDGRYAHSPASRCYRRQSPVSAAAIARAQGMPLFQAAIAHLDHSLRTGGSSLDAFAPEGMWAYLAAHPEEAREFDAAMTNQSNAANAAVLAAYDFSRFARIADIGGGQGRTLAAILDAAPSAEGVLFDLPAVVAGAAAHPRIRVVAGDFFKDDAPAGCSAYILKFILHDWPDERARRILASVRRAAPLGAKLIVIESLRPETPEFHAQIMDVSMLALFGGRERSEAEFARLFAKTGFRFARATATSAPFASIVEAEAVAIRRSAPSMPRHAAAGRDKLRSASPEGARPSARTRSSGRRPDKAPPVERPPS